jgi:transposase
MERQDTRLLSPAAQEALRRRVMAAIEQDKLTPAEAARRFGVSRQSIYNWKGKVEKGGQGGLKSRKRGPRHVSRLAPHAAATTVRLITDRCPDQLKLPYALWTREAVQVLIKRRFGVAVSVWTVGRYLKRWGLTPQKPVRRAFERDPVAVQHWLDTEYPAIAAAAKRDKAEIHWGDEMGLRSDHQTGTSYSLKGRTPVFPGTGQCFRCNMISTVTNRGRLAFMVYKQRFTAAIFLRFLRRLLRHAKGKMLYLIVDGHPVHRSAAVRRWLEKHANSIRMFRLPAYSPELNPDELLNQYVKSNALGRQRPQDAKEMVDSVRSYLWQTQRRPEIVRAYFREEHVRYAA